MKKKALAFAAMACSVAMLLSACGGSNSNAASGDTAGSNIITAYNSEPQNPLIPGNTNETGGGKPVDLLFSRLVSFDKDGKARFGCLRGISEARFHGDLSGSDKHFSFALPACVENPAVLPLFLW